jgi:hypothetical protein
VFLHALRYDVVLSGAERGRSEGVALIFVTCCVRAPTGRGRGAVRRIREIDQFLVDTAKDARQTGGNN